MIRLKNNYYRVSQMSVSKALEINGTKKGKISTFKHIGIEEMLDFVINPLYYPYFKFTDRENYLSQLINGLRANILCGLFSLSHYFLITFQNYLLDYDILDRYSSNFISTEKYKILETDADETLMEALFCHAIQSSPISFNLEDITIILCKKDSFNFLMAERTFKRALTKADYKFLHFIKEPQKHLKQLELILKLADGWYTYKNLKLICAHEWDILHRVDSWAINEKYGIGGKCKICGEELIQLSEIDIYDKTNFTKLYNYIDQDISDKKKKAIINLISDIINQFFSNQNYSEDNLLVYLYVLFGILNKKLPNILHFGNVDFESDISINDLDDFMKSEEKKISEYPGFKEIINLLLNDNNIISNHYYHPLFIYIINDLKRSNPVPADIDISSFIKLNKFNSAILEKWKETLNYQDFTDRLVERVYEKANLLIYPIIYKTLDDKIKFFYVSNNKINQVMSKNSNDLEIIEIISSYLCPINLIHSFSKDNVCVFCKFNRKEKNFEKVIGLYEKIVDISDKEFDNKEVVFMNKKIKRLTLNDFITITSNYINENELNIGLDFRVELIKYIYNIELTDKDIDKLNDIKVFNSLLSYASTMNYITKEDINLFMYRMLTKNAKSINSVSRTIVEGEEEEANHIEEDIYYEEDDMIDYD